ncbi:MAG: glycoside hydrolase family 76 protein [Limisphaerales bacterium]
MKVHCAVAFFILTTALARAIDPRAADIAFRAYNAHFYVCRHGVGYYKADTEGGRSRFWVRAEQIEMIEDAYDRTHSPATRRMIRQSIAGFISAHGADWTSNKYNDDILWMTIACARAYQDTGDKAYRTLATHHFDAVYTRGYDDALGGGLYWTTDKRGKNACVNGPGAIAACLLCEICNDKLYFAKARSLYAWERNALFITKGAVHDSERITGHVARKAFTYNEGTFIGAADLLWKLSGDTNFLADALLAANFTRHVLSWDGTLPAYGSGDAAGFNGIFMRWMARFLNDSGYWPRFYGWMSLNTDAALRVRRHDNLSWQDWTSPTPTGILNSWNCSDAVVALQVVPAREPRGRFIFGR